jgi:hypothetical protein
MNLLVLEDFFMEKTFTTKNKNYKAYTYLVGCTELNKFYYGVRYSRKSNPENFWKDYFTSSEYVKEYREKYGEPDIIQVRKTFDNADDLRESREEGIMEGRNVGKREGEASKVIEIVIKKYKKGCSVKETADMLEEPQTLIKQIYDVIGQCAPDYNVEAIYKILLDKTI